ncbi:MAG: DUF3783 domain-containing protein [Solobacterium sp.]|nr:DUF3783 domain-containing protein [Solobacterium sp.]
MENKNRIPGSSVKKILVYGSGKIRDLIHAGYSCFAADDTCLGQTLKTLFEEHTDHCGSCRGIPLAVASGFAKEEMKDLIRTVPDDDVIFAAVTDVNENWTLEQLITEVSQEHRIFRLRGDLREVLQVLGYLAERDPGLMEDDTFRQLCTGAYMYLQKDGSDEEVLKNMVDVLRMLAVRIQGE